MKSEKKAKNKKSKSKDEEKNKKVYSKDDVIYHIGGVETCIIEVAADDDDDSLSFPQSLAVDTDMYVVVINDLKDQLQLAIKAGNVTCPISVTLPVLRRNYGARLAYMFPLVLEVDDEGAGIGEGVDEEEELVSFTVILPEVYNAASPIVLGFEDLLHKFSLFEILKEDPAATPSGNANGSERGNEKPEFELSETFDPSVNTDWVGTIVFKLNDGEVSWVQMIFGQEEGGVAEAEDDGGLRILQEPTKGVISIVFYASQEEPIQRALVLETILGNCVLHSKLVVSRARNEDTFWYFFPKSDPVSMVEEFIAVILPLPKSLNPTESPEIVGIEDILHKFTTFINADVPEASEEPMETEEMVENLPVEERHKLACTIEQRGYQARTGLIKTAVFFGSGMFAASRLINKHVRTRQRPVKVSKKTIRNLGKARKISGKFLGTSIKTLNTLNIAYKKVAGATVGAIVKTPIYKKKIARGSPMSPRAVAACQIIGSSTEAIMGLYYGIKDAGRIFGEMSKAATVEVVRHRWGEESAFATQEALNVVRDFALGSWYLYGGLYVSGIQLLREGTYECIDQIANFRSWMSNCIIDPDNVSEDEVPQEGFFKRNSVREGDILMKIPLLTSSSYSKRYAVLTDEVFLIFYDRSHFLQSMREAFPDKKEMFTEDYTFQKSKRSVPLLQLEAGPEASSLSYLTDSTSSSDHKEIDTNDTAIELPWTGPVTDIEAPVEQKESTEETTATEASQEEASAKLEESGPIEKDQEQKKHVLSEEESKEASSSEATKEDEETLKEKERAEEAKTEEEQTEKDSATPSEATEEKEEKAAEQPSEDSKIIEGKEETGRETETHEIKEQPENLSSEEKEALDRSMEELADSLSSLGSIDRHSTDVIIVEPDVNEDERKSFGEEEVLVDVDPSLRHSGNTLKAADVKCLLTVNVPKVISPMPAIRSQPCSTTTSPTFSRRLVPSTSCTTPLNTTPKVWSSSFHIRHVITPDNSAPSSRATTPRPRSLSYPPVTVDTSTTTARVTRAPLRTSLDRSPSDDTGFHFNDAVSNTADLSAISFSPSPESDQSISKSSSPIVDSTSSTSPPIASTTTTTETTTTAATTTKAITTTSTGTIVKSPTRGSSSPVLSRKGQELVVASTDNNNKQVAHYVDKRFSSKCKKHFKNVKSLQTKDVYKKTFAYVSAMPLEEIDFVKMDDDDSDEAYPVDNTSDTLKTGGSVFVDYLTREERIADTKRKKNRFHLQTRDGTFLFFSGVNDTRKECSEWARDLERRIATSKLLRKTSDAVEAEKQRILSNNKVEHDYSYWLPKDMTDPNKNKSSKRIR